MNNDSQRILAASHAFAESVVSPPAKEPIKYEGYLNKECLHCGSKRFYPNEYPCKQCIEEAFKEEISMTFHIRSDGKLNHLFDDETCPECMRRKKNCTCHPHNRDYWQARDELELCGHSLGYIIGDQPSGFREDTVADDVFEAERNDN